MQYAPQAIVGSSLVAPDARGPAPAGAVFVRVAVENVGAPALRIREITLELTGGRLLRRVPQAPEEREARPIREEPPPLTEAAANDAPAEEPTPPTPTSETAKKVGEVVVVGGVVIGGAAALFCTIFIPCMLGLVAIGIVTSPIWLPVLLISKHKRNAELQQARDAALDSGDVILVQGESASAVVQFVNDGLDVDAASVILRVTDVNAERDWTGRTPVAIPK
jgi:hypothetical protein